MPAISRPLMIVLIGAVVALVGFYATQGSRNAGSDSAAQVTPPPAAAPAPEPTAAKPSAPKAEQAPPKADAAARKADTAKAAARRRTRAAKAGIPIPVARALRQHKTIVLLFRGSGSADDRATARAVNGLRGERGVVIFSDRIGRLGRYRAVVGELGISQAPAVVIVDRAHSARVVEGYVDRATLAQDVADSR